MTLSNSNAQLKDEPNEKRAFPTEKISTPRRTTSTGVIIHKQSSNFIDIEVPVNRVWLSCSPTDPKGEVSHFGVDIEDENMNYSFIPRRAVDDVPSCLAKLKEYKAMMKGAKSIRIVGVSLTLYEYKKPPKGYPDDQTPLRFRNKLKQMSSFFVRLQVGDKCKAHFPDHCDLPKNYWAGTFPVE
jgi:hypothetical protein